MSNTKDSLEKLILGWREWVALPGLSIPHIKAKVDTGARTSALHTFNLCEFVEEGQPMVRFFMHPLQHRTDIEVECVAAIIDERWVTDSGGHKEKRFVIGSDIEIAGQRWPIEFTLTNRENMKFRMLLGRTAMSHRAIVDPALSYLAGKPDIESLYPETEHH
ncbi:MAG: ATP-dependent zinc protease [Gammaproteobacteria bacterium]|nr:ATP-dependent zinc protease [Gammaproteobacteria bacterium]